MLDMVNRIQMFQLAADRANHQLKTRKQDPLFKLSLRKGPDGKMPPIGVKEPEDAFVM